MKKILVLILISVLTVFQAQAVLREKDLSQTLGVLRGELELAYNEQQAIMARFEKRNVEQHNRLVGMLQKSNQIALMLYSQNADFTFDMAYACQAATEQYRSLSMYHAPYDKMIERINSEIERYDALIKTLKRLPPRVMPDSLLDQMADSLRALLPKVVLDTASKNLYSLDQQGIEDRAACLEYATALRDNYVKMLESVELDKEHYQKVTERVSKLNAYALAKYDAIQKNIFVNGGDSYFKTLKRFNIRVHIFDFYTHTPEIICKVLRHFFRKSCDEHPLTTGGTLFHLGYQVVNLRRDRSNLDLGVNKSRRANYLLNDLLRDPCLIVGGGCGDHNRLTDLLFKFREIERSVIKRGRQAESVIDEVLLSRTVPSAHTCDLVDRDVALVDEDNVVVGEIIEQAVRGRSGLAASKNSRVVFNTGAEADLAKHLKVIPRSFLDALSLKEHILRAEPLHAFCELFFDLAECLLLLFGIHNVVRCGVDRGVVHVLDHGSRYGVDLGHAVDLVTEIFDSDRAVRVACGVDLDRISAHTELVTLERDVVSLVADLDKACEKLLHREI